jgi:hypothetical protein
VAAKKRKSDDKCQATVERERERERDECVVRGHFYDAHSHYQVDAKTLSKRMLRQIRKKKR